MLQAEEKIKKNGIGLLTLPFRIILREELYGDCDTLQETTFLCYSVDILKGKVYIEFLHNNL